MMIVEPGNAAPVTNLRTKSPLLLASASPRRSAILRSLGLEFEVVPSDIDEEAVAVANPGQLAVKLAESKAETIGRLRPDSCVVAADTVVAFEEKSLGKPATEEEAAAMLRRLSGKSHEVHTGVSVRAGDRTQSGIETTHVQMRYLTPAEIEAYVCSGAAMDKAGAYGIQDTEFSPVESFTGSYLNVVGLPLGLLARLLLNVDQIDAETAAVIGRGDSP